MEEGGRACRTKLPTVEAGNTVLELIRPVTHGKHISINNDSNEEDNTNDIGNKLNNHTKGKWGMSITITQS